MKKGVLFVGSFKKEAKDGHVGGQMFACTSLLNSKIGDQYNWYLVDSTATSVIKLSFMNRALKAFKRIWLSFKTLLSNYKQIDTLLIFTVDGFSFVEKGIILLIGKAFGKKTIIAPRSGLFPDNFKKPLFKRFIKFIFIRADYILCQGNSWKEFFLREVPELDQSKLLIMNNWIDPELYKGRIKSLETSKVVVTYIGWFEDFKGIFDIVNIIEKINAQPALGDAVEFRLAGMGSKYDEVNKAIQQLACNNVKLLGWVKGQDKEELLKDTDIYLQLSYAEGFPNSILEAMASGKAVLCTDVGAVTDLVKDGLNGFTVPIKDTEAAFQKLSMLLQDRELRMRISHNAEKTVKEDFIVDIAIEKFNKILN